jgi:hypothetical protein
MQELSLSLSFLIFANHVKIIPKFENYNKYILQALLTGTHEDSVSIVRFTRQKEPSEFTSCAVL